MSFTPTTTHAPGHKPKGRWAGWSYSKLNNFRNCPRKHYEVEITKRFADGDTNEHMEFGKAVHTAMENRIKLGTPIPAHLQAMLADDMEAWCKRVLHGFADPVDYERATGGRLGIELSLAIDEQYKPCDWFAKNVRVFGRAKIDVAKMSGPGCILLDWKTGKVNDRDNEQLLISAAIAFIHWPELQAVRTCYVWLKEAATTTLDVQRSDIQKIWADLLPLINHYRNSVETVDFPPRPSGLCKFCPVLSCEHNPRNGA